VTAATPLLVGAIVCAVGALVLHDRPAAYELLTAVGIALTIAGGLLTVAAYL
jgi:hypothetical protein